MPGNGRSEIGLPGRAMDERGRNGIPQQWTKRKRHRMPGNGRSEISLPGRGMDEVRSAYQAGEGTKKSGMVFRNNGRKIKQEEI